jgi:hypothetical protein
LPLKAIAQTWPLRLTTTAHSLLSRPPLLGPPLGLTFRCKTWRSAADWTGQVTARAGRTAIREAPKNRHDASAQILRSATAFPVYGKREPRDAKL